MSVQLAPVPVFQALANNGQFLVGGQLFTYAAGTTTPQATYVDSTQTTPNTNPVILNSRGECNLWLTNGQTYKLKLTDALGNQIYLVDNVPGGFPTQSVFNSFLQTAFPNTVFVNQSWEPAWGQPDIHVADPSGNNAIIGSIQQNTVFTGTNGSFPTGVTGYGQMNGAGNQAFGVFGRADLLFNGTATNEFDSFNFSGHDPTATFPPNLAFGTTDYNAIAFQVAAYGSNKSKIGIYIAPGAQPFIAGIYVNPSAVSQYGLFVDSGSAFGPAQPLVVKGMTSVIPVTIQTVGAFNANNSVLTVLDGLTSATRMSVAQDGHISLANTATTAAIGANGAPPAQVAGYFVFGIVGGSLVKVPYYNT